MQTSQPVSEYEKQANDFLLAAGLEFRAVLVGSDCPQFCTDYVQDKAMDQVDVFPRKTHIHGKHYRCTISAKNRGHVSFDFWNSYADEEENFFAFGGHKYGQTGFGPMEGKYWDKYRIGGKFPNRPRATKRITPTPYDLLACLRKNDPGTFHDFCMDFGYDEDSRKAETVYHAVVNEWRKVQRFFTAEELAAIREIS